MGTESFRIAPDLELVERDARGPQQRPGQMGQRIGPVVWSGTAAELRSEPAGKSMSNRMSAHRMFDVTDPDGHVLAMYPTSAP